MGIHCIMITTMYTTSHIHHFLIIVEQDIHIFLHTGPHKFCCWACTGLQFLDWGWTRTRKHTAMVVICYYLAAMRKTSPSQHLEED